tara:strand:+ start:682 stop:810 length:129 start_codon:yes stop_codon:yes gene_type:complete
MPHAYYKFEIDETKSEEFFNKARNLDGVLSVEYLEQEEVQDA